MKEVLLWVYKFDEIFDNIHRRTSLSSNFKWWCLWRLLKVSEFYAFWLKETGDIKMSVRPYHWLLLYDIQELFFINACMSSDVHLILICPSINTMCRWEESQILKGRIDYSRLGGKDSFLNFLKYNFALRTNWLLFWCLEGWSGINGLK